jgi:hypothetical protein
MKGQTKGTIGVGDERRCGRCGLDFQPKRPLERYCSDRCQTMALEEWAHRLSADDRKFWRDLLPLVERALAWVDSLPTKYAEGVLHQIRVADNRRISEYFRSELGRDPTPHELLALYRILTRSATWRKVKGPDFPLTRYLRRAVRLEGRHIRDKWNRDGILTPQQEEMERRAAGELEGRRTRILGPESLLNRLAAQEQLAPLLARVRLSERQRILVTLMLDEGFTAADALRAAGFGKPVWQSLVQKLRRAAA